MRNTWGMAGYLVALGVIVVLILMFAFIYEVGEIKKQQEKTAVNAARAHSLTVISLREWVSKQESVYTTIGEVQPNPYLKTLDRDVVTTAGVELTRINPAFMTRLVGDVINKNAGVSLRLTSLKSMNPKNAPDEWETKALRSFEKGVTEKWGFCNLNQEQRIRFMKPLLVEDSCLKCHWEQGYVLGDIKGGISISLPYEPFLSTQKRQITLLVYRFLFFGLLLGGCTAGLARKVFLYEQEKLGHSKRLEYLSQIDELMGIYNRRALMDRLDGEIENSLTSQRPLTIILFDLDKFKAVNDVYGHLAGDMVLKNTAKVIMDNVRTVDTVGRYGGDEIMIALPGLNKEKAEKVKERVEKAVAAEIFTFEGHIIKQNLSSGMAELAELAIDEEVENREIIRDLLIQTADNQLYINKELKHS